MASPSKKKGLRCQCGKLLLEKHPEMGLGVRCGRRECDEFYVLAEINRMAAGFENKNKERKMEGAQEQSLLDKLFKTVESLSSHSAIPGVRYRIDVICSDEIEQGRGIFGGACHPEYTIRVSMETKEKDPMAVYASNWSLTAEGHGLSLHAAIKTIMVELLGKVELGRIIK